MKTISYTLAVAWNELQIMFAERAWLIIIIVLPLIIGGFTGGLNLAVARSTSGEVLVEAGLVNNDTGGFGTEIARALQTIKQLKITTYASPSEAIDPVARGKATAAIVIPASFSQKIDSYTPAELEVYLDPAEPQTASIVTGIMNQVVVEAALWGEVQYAIRTILAESGVLDKASPQEKRAAEAQNLGVVMTRLNEMRTSPAITVLAEDLQGVKVKGGIELYLAYLFPGLTVMFLFFIVPMASGSLIGEREMGTMRRLLISYMPRGAILAGKSLAFILLGCIQVTILLAVAHLGFSTPLGSSLLGLVLNTIVVAFVASALGMLVAALAKTASQAHTIGMILAFVLAGIGGAMPTGPEPMSRAGGPTAAIALLTPHAHAIEGYYQLMAENATLTQILPQLGILLAMGILFSVVAVWRFRYE